MLPKSQAKEGILFYLYITYTNKTSLAVYKFLILSLLSSYINSIAVKRLLPYIEVNIKNRLKGDIKLIKKINQVFSAILAACVLFTSVPVSALSAGEAYTEQQTLDELNTENKVSTEDSEATQHTLSNATSTEVVTDSNELNEENLIEETSSEDVQSNGNLEESISEISSSDMDFSEEVANSEIALQGNSSEDGEEPSNDNWELSTVFYDSTVNNGKTPLTSIDWDASNGGYGVGTPRVITAQINYRNANAVTTYQPNELCISIPNLVYNTDSNTDNSPFWQTQITVGANDPTHSNYDWTLFDGETSASINQKNYLFYNVKTIDETANLEGSIQIVYSITPKAESESYVYYESEAKRRKAADTEPFEASCLHQYSKALKASLKKVEPPQENEAQVITSPNWPNNYDKGMTEDDNFWEFDFKNADYISVSFDNNSKLAYDSSYGLKFYSKEKNNITRHITKSYYDVLHDTTIKGKTYILYDNYLKITMTSKDRVDKGFCATVTPVYYQTITESNDIAITYRREYIHPWSRANYSIKKTANKITTLDLFPSDADNYIWVKYTFKESGAAYANGSGAYSSGRIYYAWQRIYAGRLYWQDEFPEGCVVYDTAMSKIEPINEYNLYRGEFTNDGNYTTEEFYVGYPKSKYNEESGNMKITNTVGLYGTYSDREEEECLAQGSVSLNLDDFLFSYSGNLYGISKYTSSYTTMRYQDIVGEKNGGTNSTTWNIIPTAYYTSSPMTLKIGDDLLYATDKNGDYVKLQDDEYNFSSITWNPSSFTNGLKLKIAANKYDCELWIRKTNSDEYILYDEFKNPASSKTWNLSEEGKVASFYFLIKDIKESIVPPSSTGSFLSAKTIFTKEDISESGTLYNFDYLQVYFKNEAGELVLQNEQSIDSYSSFITKEEIASYDMDTYGLYLQRAQSSIKWNYYEVPQLNMKYKCGKYISPSIIQDAENELFYSTCTIGASPYSATHHNSSPGYLSEYINDYDPKYAIKGFVLYDLLPQGAVLHSSIDEIKESVNIDSGRDCYITDTNFKKIPLKDVLSKTEIDIIKTENYNNTGRTMLKIEVHLSEPMYWFNYYDVGNYRNCLCFDYRMDVPYDSFIEYGNVWRNNCYMTPLKNQVGAKAESGYNSYPLKDGYTVKDNGSIDPDVYDINSNGDDTETISYSYDSMTITSVVSTHQDVQTQVQTVNDNFTVGKGTSPYNAEYTYKLRVRTGQNAATNMVIANNLEMAYRDKKFWQGEFKGIDTSYIENKTWMVYDPKNENANSDGYVPKKIIVKPYYSTNPEETDLYLTEQTIVNEDGKEVSKTIFKEDGNGNILKNTNWKEYTDDVDKGAVKSLAFELLDAETNKPAVIPSNSLLYVLVKMQAPVDPYEGDDTIDQSKRPLVKDIKTHAYNNCWTQWNPIDETFNTKVDFVTGIHSNIVRVALPYTVEDEAVINLRFIKAIDGTDEAFEKMKLKKDNAYKFHITLTNQETGDIIQGILDSKTGLQINEIPVGTYLIKESDDIYFDFVDMTAGTFDGIIFEKTDDGYMLTIDNTISENVTFEITVNNRIEPDRPYEDKEEKSNLFGF